MFNTYLMYLKYLMYLMYLGYVHTLLNVGGGFSTMFFVLCLGDIKTLGAFKKGFSFTPSGVKWARHLIIYIKRGREKACIVPMYHATYRTTRCRWAKQDGYYGDLLSF
jgi:hypothetical protein